MNYLGDSRYLSSAVPSITASFNHNLDSRFIHDIIAVYEQLILQLLAHREHAYLGVIQLRIF